jgi:hypothetical protein
MQPDGILVLTQKLKELNVKLQEMTDLITSLHDNMKAVLKTNSPLGSPNSNEYLVRFEANKLFYFRE